MTEHNVNLPATLHIETDGSDWWISVEVDMTELPAMLDDDTLAEGLVRSFVEHVGERLELASVRAWTPRHD